MTNTNQLLARAEKRVAAGDVPDDVDSLMDACLSKDGPDTYTALTAAFEAGRLQGVDEGKREGVALGMELSHAMWKAVSGGVEIDLDDDGSWSAQDREGEHESGGDYLSFMKYLEKQQ